MLYNFIKAVFFTGNKEQLNKINDYYNNLKSVNANSIIKKQTETKTSIGRDKK